MKAEDGTIAVLYQRAYQLVESNRSDEAKSLLEECLRLRPPSPYDALVRQELARILQGQKDLDGVLRLRLEVRALAPQRHENSWKLAQLLAELGRLPDALREATHAVSLEPANQNYRALSSQLRLRLAEQDSSDGTIGLVYTDYAFGFQLVIPRGWRREVGLLARLSQIMEKNALSVTAHRRDGFARMAVRVRPADGSSFKRQQVEYKGEARLTLAGVPATGIEYVGGRKTVFRKIAVLKGNREYLLQFGHDGTFDAIIDAVVESFRFL